MTILYATETGCSRDVAQRVAREARRRAFHPAVWRLDLYDRSKLPEGMDPLVLIP